MRITDIIKNIHWNETGTTPALDAASLHLWKIPIGIDGGSVEDLRDLLSPREIASAERLHQSSHRDRYIRTHAGLRRILSGYLRVDPQEVGFTYASAGKPSVATASPAVQFNLTTSADLALLAISADLPVGIDCERIRERTYLVGIAKRMFAPDVAESIAEAPKHDQLKRFYQAWTALESRVKEDGRGLFAGREETIAALPVAHFVPVPGYIAAVTRKNLPASNDWATLQIRSD